MKMSVFCGVSVDGFLARPDHALDFLEAGGSEPHGFEEFFGSVDVLVIGRKTFEVVLTFGKWPYGKKSVVVLSSRPLDFSSIHGGTVEQMSGDPADIAIRLGNRGFQHAYVDGGVTIQRFLAAGLIDRMIVTRVPGADRGRHTSLWPCAARYRAAPRRDALLSGRAGAE